MMIPHPLLGPRDASEFTYLGDAALINRPQDKTDGLDQDMSPRDRQDSLYQHVYLRDNPAGVHRELWYHEMGDRSWLVVTRDTTSHDIISVELARDVARAEGRGR